MQVKHLAKTVQVNLTTLSILIPEKAVVRLLALQKLAKLPYKKAQSVILAILILITLPLAVLEFNLLLLQKKRAMANIN